MIKFCPDRKQIVQKHKQIFIYVLMTAIFTKLTLARQFSAKNSYIRWHLRSSGILCSVYFVFTEVSGQPIRPIFKAWPLKMGTDRLSRNVGNYQPTPCNIIEERRSLSQGGGSLKSRKLLHRTDVYGSPTKGAAADTGFLKQKRGLHTLRSSNKE